MGNEFGICLRDGRELEISASGASVPLTQAENRTSSPSLERVDILPSMEGDFFAPVPSHPQSIVSGILSNRAPLRSDFFSSFSGAPENVLPQPVSPALYQELVLVQPSLATEPQAQLRTIIVQQSTPEGFTENVLMVVREELPPSSPGGSGGRAPTPPPSGGNPLPFFGQVVPIAVISIGLNIGVQAALNRELQSRGWTSQERMPVLFASSLLTTGATQFVSHGLGFTGALDWKMFGSAILISRGATVATIFAADQITGNTSPLRNTVISIGMPIGITLGMALGTRLGVQTAVEGALLRTGLRSVSVGLAIVGIPFLVSDLTRIGMAIYASQASPQHAAAFNFDHFAFSLETYQSTDCYAHHGSVESLMPLIHLTRGFRAPSRVGLELAQHELEQFTRSLELNILALALNNTNSPASSETLNDHIPNDELANQVWNFDFDWFRRRLRDFCEDPRYREGLHFFFAAYHELKRRGFPTERFRFWAEHLSEEGNLRGENREILQKISEIAYRERQDIQRRLADRALQMGFARHPTDTERRAMLAAEDRRWVNGHRQAPDNPYPLVFIPTRDPRHLAFMAPPTDHSPAGQGLQWSIQIDNLRLLMEALERARP